ncbi:hypothetical protein HMPREF1549_00707 [Actinomyces johnsonii F0510]|uniref:Uncharacterized protein n=1 Tax=Actinomyces johnsonii F0510 TaxID=1227262 RepID=U1QHH4_9ACTO|nr:hypothetical protein HMPREF1549_00707 [Actinomyces johnsonii F0510]
MPRPGSAAPGRARTRLRDEEFGPRQAADGATASHDVIDAHPARISRL